MFVGRLLYIFSTYWTLKRRYVLCWLRD